MGDLHNFIQSLYCSLIGQENYRGNIIRRHTKKLETLGDISFPLNPTNWYRMINNNEIELANLETIVDYLSNGDTIELQLLDLMEQSKQWDLQIEKNIVYNNDIHLFLNRPNAFELCIKNVLHHKENYGFNSTKLTKPVIIEIPVDIKLDNLSLVSLSELRLFILKNVISNLINSSEKHCEDTIKFALTLKSNQGDNSILCGSILNKNGSKDNQTTALELYQKRKTDMQLMAQHKYGIQVTPSPAWNEYFEMLGKAAVTIEMLQNRPHKCMKVTLGDTTLANKNASFIFYNCARLAALFREFSHRIENNVYPELPPIDSMDFTLLNQPEEWELLFVYVLQFPLTIGDCISDVESGVVNPHYLVSFLTNLASVFSGYYRRIRILTEPRDHLFAVLFARIHLLKAIQQVFHTSLRLLDIEPIKEM